MNLSDDRSMGIIIDSRLGLFIRVASPKVITSGLATSVVSTKSRADHNVNLHWWMLLKQ